MIPVIWDTGHEGDMNMTVIRRQTTDATKVGEIVDYEVLNAMRTEYGMTALPGNSIDALVNESNATTNKSLVVTYDYRQDTTSKGIIRIPATVKDLSGYTGMSVRAYVNGSAAEVDGIGQIRISKPLPTMLGPITISPSPPTRLKQPTPIKKTASSFSRTLKPQIFS